MKLNKRRFLEICLGLICLQVAQLSAAVEDPTVEPPTESLIDHRLEYDRQAALNPFSVSTHKANYFIPISYMVRPNDEPFEAAGEPSPRDAEAKFQISFKLRLAKGVFRGYGNMYFGYTQQSYWQVYDQTSSQPFREINHEPELFFSFPTDREIAGFKARIFNFSFNHQSNGRRGTLSRGWNRVCAEAILERHPFYISIKPWFRIPELGHDDNPDIYKYLGYGEITGLYQLGKHQLGILFRNNMTSNNKGAVQLEWVFPIHAQTRGFVQYFDGYGESLIDYDHHNRRFSLGLLLSNWL